AQFRVGQILREIATPTESVAAFSASIELWEELVASAPDDPRLRARLADAYLTCGEQYAQVRNFTLAFPALGRSREILVRLRAESRRDPTILFRRGDCDKERGIAEAEAGQHDGGLVHLSEAEALLRQLLSRSPADVRYRQLLAGTINGLGFIYSEKHRD